MARIGRKAAAVAAFAACLASPLLAQTVPLPSPKPHPAQSAPSADAEKLAAAGQTHAQGSDQSAQKPPAMIPTNPFAALLGTPGTTTALTPEQRATIDRVNKYLSSTQVLSGNFVQIGPDGTKTKGQFFISKPGKVRFEYDPPSPIDIVADGQSVVVRDRNLATQDVYPLSQTPLRFLLSDHVNLLKDTNLVALYSDDVFITVVVEEKNGLVGTSRLMIMFSTKDMQIKQWTVTDPQGYDTTVAVYNLDTTKRPDPSLFKIDYTRYHN
ncbi:MAG TPA: outer membrane lipoprotein carrier protein LolA [Pseudolabrys sp.]|nr:outer membrane lipoprotein carrier protein LolA [Pseudolabrys sp.]